MTIAVVDTTALPWPVIVSGVVGAVGIVGTLAGSLLTTYLNNRAAEKRRLAEQRHEDRTRFHKERAEIYTRFISATKEYRELLVERRYPVPALLSDTVNLRAAVSAHKARAAYAEVRETLLLVAEDNVARIADRVFGAVTTLEDAKMLDSTFEEWDQRSLAALAEFRKAARAELQPT